MVVDGDGPWVEVDRDRSLRRRRRARLVIAWKSLVKDNVVSKLMPRNLAEVKERMALPCNVMCQSERYQEERWNKSSLASVQPYSPLIGIHCQVIHRLLQFCGDDREVRSCNKVF